ncbi:hypothetical protein MPTK1_5g11510 [Marchantia polymorpha subsp. ruderalis]|uniref:Uncharacterized protein n=2 Tax=Marchantia polymorpha TaxID=3197 RepID=A0AAF6BHA9_MARPO|nr:hypothetical protein MARPO_0093s0074 [Marchantia polymorpha]BBN11393.1 hypothetical protein Mp_5g11510 [Marchantia polymorpha subsp. ruderalis]|eukprot:PTQ33006.1 hypothetical protein MARPO_0093s0074 [Marchantia polymorpha]
MVRRVPVRLLKASRSRAQRRFEESRTHPLFARRCPRSPRASASAPPRECPLGPQLGRADPGCSLSLARRSSSSAACSHSQPYAVQTPVSLPRERTGDTVGDDAVPHTEQLLGRIN